MVVTLFLVIHVHLKRGEIPARRAVHREVQDVLGKRTPRICVHYAKKRITRHLPHAGKTQ